MMVDKGIFDVKELACYISSYYGENYKKQISPLKLQKSLYFCYAYWGGFIFKNSQIKNKKSEINMDFSNSLFDASIEAWVYGPVVPEVYHEKNLEKYCNSNLFKNKEVICEFINNILNDILPLNDFRLVDISHEDKCWKKYFKENNMFHNIEIPKIEIIKEYARHS